MGFLKTILCFLGLSVLVALPSQLHATPALVFDYKTGQVYSKTQIFDRWYPASLTKLMTAYTVFREVKGGLISLNSPVKISKAALAEPPSKMGFPVRTTLNFDNALKIIMVKSSNDVAHAIGQSAAGTLPRFVAKMNANAKRLGMKDSNFTNPHGLHDDNQFTSARDMGILAKAILDEFPQYSEYFNISAIKFGGRSLRNHNRLVHRFAGANGMKTGFTCPSGLNIVVSRQINGKNLIAVVMGMKTGRERNAKAATLLHSATVDALKYGQGGFEELARTGEVIEPVNLRPIICVKKKKPKVTKDNFMMFFPLRNETLQEKEDRLYQAEEKMDNVVTVSLGSANGPDPYALNLPKQKHLALLTPKLSSIDGSIPSQPDNYLQELRQLEDLIVLRADNYKIPKGKRLPVPTTSPERDERLAFARHKYILPQLSNPDGSIPQQPDHYLQTIWDADWQPTEARPLFTLDDGKVVTIPRKKAS